MVMGDGKVLEKGRELGPRARSLHVAGVAGSVAWVQR